MINVESLMMENLFKYKRLNEKKLEIIAQKNDLRKIDMEIILFLAGSNEKDTAKDIAATEKFTKGHISQAVKRLVQKGFINTVQDKKDLRIQHLKLEKPAMKVFEEIVEVKKSIDECVFKGVTEEETQVLKDVSKKMFNNIMEEVDN